MGNYKNEISELDRLLKQEKNLQAEWYLRMSGQKPWADGERQRYTDKFCELSDRIRKLQAEASRTKPVNTDLK